MGSDWRNALSLKSYRAIFYFTSVSFFKTTSQTSQQFDLALHFSNSNLLNETMGKTEVDAYRYSETVVSILGILGNILVILSILKQKKNVLKNNYYFLVLHLAICDLIVLIFYLLNTVDVFWLQEQLSGHSSMIICHVNAIDDAFQFTGVGMMLIISLLRYRATVDPLKPAIRRRKLKRCCGLVYIVGLIAACGTGLPQCFIKSNIVYVAHQKFYGAFGIFFIYLAPTIFMAVVYYKIGRSLMKQNKHMKRVCLDVMRQREPDSPFNILRYIRNRRTFLVCLSTVLCYGTACIPLSVWFMWAIVGENHQMKFGWVGYFAYVLNVGGSHSINPLIYGILDKKLLTFWKCCCKKKRTQENQKIVIVV